MAEKSLVNDDTETVGVAPPPPAVVVVVDDFDELPHAASASVTTTTTGAHPMRLCERDILDPPCFR
jgi:hypothetical protein